MRALDIPEISGLSTPEKILLVEDLWEDIAEDVSNVVVPESHKRELDRRLENHMTSPGRLLSLEELQLRVEARK